MSHCKTFETPPNFNILEADLITQSRDEEDERRQSSKLTKDSTIFRENHDKKAAKCDEMIELNYWIMKILTSWLNRCFTSRKEAEKKK